ncbi:WD40 repeat-like protein [Marasmius fiardii PR-910]|nr:WD40 repeat-like protein [Marasmius fiardii PR-910]
MSSSSSSQIKIYTVNGATVGSSSSLPDWLTRKKKGNRKRIQKEHYEGTIELIQGFEFPEASNKVKTTNDGAHVIATGTYKPQIRVWDLDQLSLKFERHTDSENVDFVILSNDWTKSIHLQTDRTVELHTQGGFHYRTRIPRFGRSLAYHFPSCDALFSASGNEIYRLNLEQGRFLAPLVLEDQEEVEGVNCIDINPAHQLWAFGIESTPSVQFWDPRSRNSVGVLRLPASKLSSPTPESSLGITAISSRNDGLNYAIGTSTGHTLLYDIRSSTPYAVKDQGYGMPITSLSWIQGGNKMASEVQGGMVLSADRKVVKVWERGDPTNNFFSLSPPSDLNHVHHIPSTGLILTANEGIQMSTFFIPQLGPAPKWASFLENVTEEMEDSTGVGGGRSGYEDFKFVERSELDKLGLSSLLGTPLLKPYMHGYFISLKLYDTARVISNPFVYSEHRESEVRRKMDKLAETRIRSTKNANANATAGIKVNKALAEKILKEEERVWRKEERKRQKDAQKAVDVNDAVDAMEVDAPTSQSASLLTDPRFSKIFEDSEFEVDVNSREYALLNPSSVAQLHSGARGKTAVEDEEEESDKMSSDGLDDDDESGSGSDDDEGEEGDSSDEGELTPFDPRSRPGQRNLRAEEAYARNRQQNRNHSKTNPKRDVQQRNPKVTLVPMRLDSQSHSGGGKDVSFGERRGGDSSKKQKHRNDEDGEGGMEVSWVPSASSTTSSQSQSQSNSKQKGKPPRKGFETFGMGMERGGDEQDEVRGGVGSERERKGRTVRRKGVRSGSRNVFRRM